MTWFDITYFVLPWVGIWFLGVTILIAAIIWLINNAQIIRELRKTRIEGTEQLRKTRSELGADTADLRKDLSGLKEEMGKTRHSIENWHKTMWWWK